MGHYPNANSLARASEGSQTMRIFKPGNGAVRLLAALAVLLLFIAPTAWCAEEEEAPPTEQIEVDTKPPEHGVYIYRNGDFIPLAQKHIQYSGVWFGVSLSVVRLAAGFIPDEEMGELPSFEDGDYLAFYFPGVGKMKWAYYPMALQPEVDFCGDTEAEIWVRPEAWYPGLAAIGDARALSRMFGYTHRDNYHYEQGKVEAGEVVYQDKELLVAKFGPNLGLALDKYLITNKDFMFDNMPGSGPVAQQLPVLGWAVSVGAIARQPDFQARTDALGRFNERHVVHHLLEEREYELAPGQDLDTGIKPSDPGYIRFISDKDFFLVLGPGEADQGSRLPPECGQVRENLPGEGEFTAYRVDCRNFALLFTGAGKNRVRIMGGKEAAKVTVIYSPLFGYEDRYRQHVETGWEHFEKGEYAEAIAEYETALEILPDYPDAMNNMAWLYATAKDKEFWKPRKALELAEKAAQYLPVRAHILDTLAEAYFVNGDLEKALEFEKRAYAGWKEPPGHHKKAVKEYEAFRKQWEKATDYAEILDYENAIKELHFLLEKYPNYVEALDTLAWIYATATDKDIKAPDLAMDLAQTAYFFAPEKPQVLDTMAEALWASGEKEKALEYSEKAAYYAPKDKYFAKRLARMKARVAGEPESEEEDGETTPGKAQAQAASLSPGAAPAQPEPLTQGEKAPETRAD